MQEQSKRKPRVRLSPEEFYYFVQLKKVKQIEKLEEFKGTFFYKIFNRINIFFAGLLTYFILSIIIVCSWEEEIITFVNVSFGEMKMENKQRTISDIEIHTSASRHYFLKTDYLFESPKVLQNIVIGKDFIFEKPLKAKLEYDKREFWFSNTYAVLTVCSFALLIGFFVYNINKHLSINGLLTVFGLFFLASVYFILI